MNRNLLCLLGVPLAAVALSVYKIDLLPGTHGDEAWVVLRALREISQGTVSFSGMNHYTGSLFHLMVTPFMMLFGFTPLVSRLCAIGLNAVALVFIMLTAERLTRSRLLMPATGLWTLTLPAFLLDSRFAVEICALNPLLDSLAVYLLVSSFQEKKRTPASTRAAVSGCLFAAAAYNHGSGIYLPIGIALAALLLYRGEMVRNHRSWAAGLGFSFVFIALAWLRGWERHAGSLYQKHLGDLLAPERLRDLIRLPAAIIEEFDGVALFKRYLGSPDPVHVPVFFLALALLAGFAWKNRSEPALIKQKALFGLAWLIGVAFTALSAPYLATNYFHIWQILLPLVLFSTIPWSEKSETNLPVRIKVLLLAGIPLLQVGNLGVQYFAEFQRYGTRPLVYPIGERLFETSNHFLPTGDLYDRLRQEGIDHVAGEQLLLWNLEALSLKHKPLTTMTVEFPDRLRGHAFARKTAYVAYNADQSIAGKFYPAFPKIPYPSGSGLFLPSTGFEGHFSVWVFEPPAGPSISLAGRQIGRSGHPIEHAEILIGN